MNVKWSEEDNLIGKAELEMSAILTQELTARPEITLHLIFASSKVMARLRPILEELTRKLNHPLVIGTHEYRENGRRIVMVDVERKQGATQP